MTGDIRITIQLKAEEFGTVIPKAEMERRIREAHETLGYEVDRVDGTDVGTYVGVRKKDEELWHLLFLSAHLDPEGIGYYIPPRAELRKRKS